MAKIDIDKVIDAPEKIYLQPNIGGKELIRPWLTVRFNQDSVEYTRTDIFIEKALEFFENDLCCYIKAQDFVIEHGRLEKDFKNYMKQ